MEDNIAAAAGQDQPNQAAEPSEEIHVCRKPPRKKTYWGLWLLLILLMIAAAGIWLFYINDFQLSIRLKEDGEYLLEYGDSYQEPGMEAVLSGRWLLQNGYVLEEVPVQWETDLQQDTLGKYTVNYTAEFYGWTASAQRTVRVVDTVCPVLTLIDTDYTVLPGNPYEEEGYLAVDNHDGNLTDKVKKSRKRDIITYTVWDSSGNPASAERKIPYLDPESPILVLEGGEYIRHTSGRFYTDPGYSAEDNVDGDLTEMVAIEGEVVWYRPGIYDIVYTIADAFGNVTQKIRTVEVVAEPQPEVVYPVGKTIYLTFDDGPGPYTGQLLDLLRQYGVKATFFVTDTGDKNGYLWRMHREGHSIGIHTMTHDYNSIYASPEAFFQDLYGMQDVIYRETGIKTTLMRFPGGGSNLVSNFNEGIMTTLTQAVQDAGFQYFDWNVDSNDAGGARTSAQVVANVTEGIQKQRHSIVLQHDIHDFSVEAVEEIILWGLNNGYQFLPLTPSSPTMHHEVLN